MKTLSFRPLADKDLEDIWRFTVTRWDRAQADAYVTAIIGVVEALIDNVERHPEARSLHPGLRKARSGSHLIYFFANDEGVDVVRILHERRDLETGL